MATFDELGEFLDFVWGTEPVDDSPSFVHLRSEKQGQWQSTAAEWPRQRDAVIDTIMKLDAQEHNVFFAPALFTRGRGKREFVKGSWVYWVDFDGNAPDDWPKDPPSLRVQSSTEGHEHCYWKLHTFVRDAEQIEDRNRALAAHFDADTSGWDAAQILRPIGTTNRKPGKMLPVRLLTPIDFETAYVPAAAFTDIPSIETKIKQELATLAELPSVDDVKALAKWSQDQLDLFSLEHPEDRSGKLTRLAYNGAEARWTDEQIMAVLLDADNRWGKYKTRYNQRQLLAQIIGIARSKYGYDWDPGPSIDFERMFERTTSVETGLPWFKLGEFLAGKFDIEWMVEGLMERKGIGLITGFPGVGKTQLSLSLGLHLAAGRDWLGWELQGEAKTVLFMSLEMSESPLHQFTSTIVGGYDDHERLMIDENFFVFPPGVALSLDAEAGKKYFERMLDAVRPDIVIIDSLQRISTKPLTDEVSVKEIFDYLAEVRRSFECAFAIIHHNRKLPTVKQIGQEIELSDVFGSTYIAANVDWVLSLKRGSTDDPNLLQLDHLKNRLGPERHAITLSRDENLGFHFDGQADGLQS